MVPQGDETARRLFVAVRPPPSVATALSALPRPAMRHVRWVDPAHWHVTLRFLPKAVPAEVAAALDRAALAPAEVRLGPRIISFADRVVVIPAAGLDRLAASVLEVTGHLGPTDPRPFSGHLTLARTKQGAVCPLVGQPFTATFTAAAVELVASDTTGSTARHQTLASWPLVGPDG